jgi:hypothetical protein
MRAAEPAIQNFVPPRPPGGFFNDIGRGTEPVEKLFEMPDLLLEQELVRLVLSMDTLEFLQMGLYVTFNVLAG